MAGFSSSRFVSGCLAAMLVAQGDLEDTRMLRWHHLYVPSLILGRGKNTDSASYKWSCSMDAAMSLQLPVSFSGILLHLRSTLGYRQLGGLLADLHDTPIHGTRSLSSSSSIHLQENVRIVSFRSGFHHPDLAG